MEYQPAHRPPSDYVRSLATDIWLAIGVVVGLFLMMIGSWMWGLGESEGWHDAGMVLKGLGLFVMTAALYMGAILRADMNKWVRVALLLSATALLVLVGFWGSFWPTMWML